MLDDPASHRVRLRPVQRDGDARLVDGQVERTEQYPTRFSTRQREVLDAALQLLVDGGDKALTTAALARAANCSKQTLYKWFYDRDALLSAIVTHQVSKVRAVDNTHEPQNADDLVSALREFAEDLLAVLFSETSLALNRVSMGAVRKGDAGLGRLLMERGKQRIEERAMQLIGQGQRLGLLRPTKSGDAYQALYGLIIGDLHVRGLLGDRAMVEAVDVPARAASAIEQFLTLFAVSAAD